MSNKPSKKVCNDGSSYVDPTADTNLQSQLSRNELFYSLSGLVVGLVCILGGIILFLNGIVGATSWTAKILGAESTVSDAAPGALLFIVGMFCVFITRYKFVHKSAS